MNTTDARGETPEFVSPFDEPDAATDEAAEPTLRRSDAVGIFLSVLCAIHCAATPVLVAALPSLGLSWFESPWVHQAAFFGCFLLAGWAVWSGFRVHRRRPVIGVAAGGLMLLAASAFVWPAPCCAADAAEAGASCACCHVDSEPASNSEPASPVAKAGLGGGLAVNVEAPSSWTDLWLRLMTPLGGCLLVVAHGLNIRWTRRCQCGCCPA